MKRLASCLFAAHLATGCQPSDHVDPVDDRTGTGPDANIIFSFDATLSAPFLDANLSPSNAISASYAVAGGVLVPIQENGRFPASAGADADLLAGVGFGTYPNPDLRGAEVNWEGADPFQSVLTAEVTLGQPGDAVKFCRSFASTCATVTLDALGGGLVVMDLAANVPDTEIGEIAPGISAAVRGTGDAGLTIALTEPTRVLYSFSGAEEPFVFTWTVARGAIPGSLEYEVAINGEVVGSGNTASDLAASIATPGGVSLIFDAPLGGETEIDYSYSYGGFTGNFTNNLGFGVNLSPQPDLVRTPLYVYPTVDPGYQLGTMQGAEGEAHVVQEEDAVIASYFVPPGQEPQARVVSTEFNGDDFAGTPLEGLVDQGIEGAGFYPSPSLCYSQILPEVREGVKSGVTRVVHQRMYGGVANGVLAADASLEQLSLVLQGPPFNLPATQVGYTRVGDIGAGDIAGYITIGTDYADENVAVVITTSVLATYTVTLAEPVSQTFVSELGGIRAALEANNFAIRDALIAAGAMTLEDYIALVTLHVALTESPGSQDGAIVNGSPVLDDGVSNCRGYDCNVAVLFRDIVDGINLSGQNPTPGIPALAAGCLWGVPPTPGQPAQDATLTGNPTTDHPAYPAVAAEPALPPVREIASSSINDLVTGIFGNFVSAAFGPTVPASNFSVSMRVGDTDSGLAPAISSLVITRE